MLKDRSIICFGGEDWWYHHPHSKNHLMRRFALAGNKVIFVNSISMGLASVRSKDLVPRIARKLKSYAKLARTTEEGITVVSPDFVDRNSDGHRSCRPLEQIAGHLSRLRQIRRQRNGSCDGSGFYSPASQTGDRGGRPNLLFQPQTVSRRHPRFGTVAFTGTSRGF